MHTGLMQFVSYGETVIVVVIAVGILYSDDVIYQIQNTIVVLLS